MSLFFGNSILRTRILMDKIKDEGGGGGGGGGADDLQAKLDAEKARNDALEARLAALEGKKKSKSEDEDDEEEDQDLRDKARRMRADEDRKNGDTKALEAALKFSLNSSEFLKTNANLLPKDIADIFKAADAEKYDSAVEKANAIKAGVIQSFFSVQSNVDLLTPGLKSQLEDYLKLTKNGKQEKAQQIYDMIFEPAFDTLKRVKKAEALSKGYGSGSDSEDAYKNKLVGLSKKHYLKEK